MWIILDRWVARAATLAAFLALARLLTPEEMSEIVWPLFLATLAGMLTENGIASLLLNSRDAPSDSFIANCMEATRVVAQFLILGGAVLGTCYWFSGQHSEAVAIWVASIGHLFIPANAIPYALLAREFQYRTLVVRRVVSQVLSAIVAIILAVAGAGATSVAAQYVCASAVSALIFRLSVLPGGRERVTNSFSLRYVASTRLTLRRGLAVIGASFLPFMAQQGFILSLPFLLSPLQTGQLVFALSLFGVATDLIVSTIGASYWPIFARLDRLRAKSIEIGSAIRHGAFLVLGASAGSLGLVIGLFQPVVGQRWDLARAVLLVMLTTVPALAWTQLHRSALLSHGLLRQELRLSALSQVGIIFPLMGVFHGDLRMVGYGFIGRALFMMITRLIFGRAIGDATVSSQLNRYGLGCIGLMLFIAALTITIGYFDWTMISWISGGFLLGISLTLMLAFGALQGYHALTAEGGQQL